MPYRAAFDCLWCGTRWSTRGPDDLEGWAQLCPDCVGRAGDNEFLRFRLRTALEERGRAAVGTGPIEVAGGRPERGAEDELGREMVAYYQARAGEYDDWYLRRGRYAHGPIHDQAWNAELDQATRWLDALPLAGEIVELATGTGWWSPLLASKGSLSCYDAAEAPLDLARERLLAHRLRAHLHVRDAWAEPDRQVDAIFCGFWLSHIPSARLPGFLALVRRWLEPGGTFAFVDSRPDPSSGAIDQPARDTAAGDPAAGASSAPRPASPEVVRRRLADGREFRVVKVFHEPAELADRLREAGFASAEVSATPRFFLLGRATA
jgi:demethylmenaquinone methyltransferase/2-methoxy-6-polyprenyl-1,4-benzoquinol methylase